MLEAVDDDLAYGAPVDCYKVDVPALYTAMIKAAQGDRP
jgi:hypothetical protein